ncbi:hypothetical protein FisN_2Lh350 [Fistulifera solaris]|uniref:Uncharacterized protein n=1 Tax=Fistulifera solaris TaxID=1519565 RepID=A0A1Z5J8I0_FISSO|nr:hypothetical protein FisN_2Lh350 [Fistulifera solaris]|eukprot:GAX10081.1 hypothetical protein FisN_2Lh350 [Fistulifera solaris]
MAIKIRDSMANIPDNEIWRDHEGLIEILVQLSFTMKSPKDNVLLKKKLSVSLLNSCRKLVKESTVSKDNKVAFRLLRAAIYGIRVIVAAEGQTVPKPEGIIKLLYHIISTLESIAHKKHSVSRLAAYYTVLSLETLGLVLRRCCSDFVDHTASETIQWVFPIPRLHCKESLSLSLSKEQLLTIGNHVILSCSRVFLLPLWHTNDAPLRTEEELLLRCLPVAKKQTPFEMFHLSANLICTIARPWQLQLFALGSEGSLKESIALSRRANKILWDCVDGYEEAIGPDAVLSLRHHSIACLLAIIPRNAHEMKGIEKELFRTQFASACSQASKAILVCDQLAHTNIASLRMILEDIGRKLDSIAKRFDGAEIASYFEFCGYRALYGGSLDPHEKKYSDHNVDTCIFHNLPYRFQCKDPFKGKLTIDYASLSIVCLALDVIKAIGHENASYEDMRVVNFLLDAIQNFETMISADPSTSSVRLQFWFKIFYKTSLNRMISKAAEGDDQNLKSHPALFLAAQLLHRCYWSMAKAISTDTEGLKGSSVWEFGCDCVIKSIVAYQKLELVDYRTEAIRSCLKDIVTELCSKKFDEYPKFQERAAKLFALNGKSLIDKDVTDGALDSMLHSVRLFMHLSQNGVSDIQFQVSLRLSAIGSIYMNMNRWEEATMAFIMALLKDAEESALSRKELTGDCWLAFFKFLSTLSNGIFHIDHVEERFQSPRRLRLVFKIIQCLRELGNVTEGPSISWESPTAPLDVVEMLLGRQILNSQKAVFSGDSRSGLEDMLSYLFRIDGRGFSTRPESTQDLEYIALLFLLYKQIQKEASRIGIQEPVCCCQRVLSSLLDKNIHALIASSSKAFFGELLRIMLEINKVCESTQIPRIVLARLVSALSELGRCPEGGWEVVILSFRLSLQARLFIDGNACESECFDDVMADARRLSIGIGSCLTAEGSFARACATGAMMRLRDYLIINGFDLSASLCAFWYREHSAERNDMLVPWYDLFANVPSNINHVPLVNFQSIKAIGSASRITEDRELAMRASSFLAAVSQARSSVNIRQMRNELDILIADAESLLTLQNGDKISLEDIAACWIKSSISLGRGELEKICGNYVDAIVGQIQMTRCN